MAARDCGCGCGRPRDREGLSYRRECHNAYMRAWRAQRGTDAADVKELASRHPGWLFGVAWIVVPSGPDVRCLVASRDGILVSGWTAGGLSEAIRHAT